MNLEVVWSAYQSSLKAFLHKNISNASDVDDLLQDILIKTFQSLHKVQEAKKVKSWLFQVANHTIIDYYRKRGYSSNTVDDGLWYDKEEENIFQQLSQCIIPFIHALPDNQATLLTAIEIEGISQKDYAIQTGVKYSTLKSRVKKSRQALLKLFNNCCELSVDEKGNFIGYSAKIKACTKC